MPTQAKFVVPAVQGTSLRDEHRRITRERLVEAAELLFQSSGFRATTVEQIAKGAGTTVTTFYRYFKSKADLVCILQTQLTVEVLDVLKKLEAIRTPTRKAVRAWVNEYFEMWQRLHALCEAYWEATTTDAALAREIMPVTLTMAGKLTDLLNKIPGLSKARAQLRLSVLVLAMDRVAYVVASQGITHPERSDVLDEYAEVLWRSLFEDR